MYLLRPENKTEVRQECVNRNRNSIPVLVFKPGQTWFTFFAGVPYVESQWDRSSKIPCMAIQLQTSGLGSFSLCWNIDVTGIAGTSTFSFISFSYLVFVFFLVFSLSSRAVWKKSSARSSSSTYHRSYGKHNKRFLVFFYISLAAFHSKRPAVNTSAALHFLLVSINEDWREKSDWRVRTKKSTAAFGETRSLSRWQPVLFSFSHNFSHFLHFWFEIELYSTLLPWKLLLSNESRSFCTCLSHSGL